MFAFAQLIVILVVSFAWGREMVLIDLEGENAEEEKKKLQASTPIDNIVLRLNRVIFEGNILQPSPYVQQWVVLYCLPWYEPCQGFQIGYNEFAVRIEDEYNQNTYQPTAVRFAQVDCSTDKVLCNEMGAAFFPYIVIYEEGNVSSSWIWNGRGTPQKGGSALLERQLSLKLNQSQVERRAAANLEQSPREALKAFATAALLQCRAMLVSVGARFESSWLGQQWFALDTDLRDAMALVAMACTVWAIFKKMMGSAIHATSSVCDRADDKKNVQHTNPNAIAGKSIMLPSDLRKRRQKIQPASHPSSSQLGKSMVL